MPFFIVLILPFAKVVFFHRPKKEAIFCCSGSDGRIFNALPGLIFQNHSKIQLPYLKSC
jgi:hypothetical protein